MRMTFLDRYRSDYMTPLSFLGLLGGAALGLIAYLKDVEFLLRLGAVAEPIVISWAKALAVVAIPLIVAYLIVAIVSSAGKARSGQIAILAFSSHAVLILLTGTLGMLALVPLHLWPPPKLIDSSESSSTGEAASEIPGLIDYLANLITNPVSAVLQQDILSILVWTIIFAVASLLAPAGFRSGVVRVFRRVAVAGELIIGWMLILLPPVAFILALALTSRIGVEVVDAAGYYIALSCGVLLVAIAALYLVTLFVGGTPLPVFARAAAPVQALAFGCRSSLACTPAVMEAARDELKLPESVVGLVVPLSGAAFKLSRPANATVKLGFLAASYGVSVEPLALITYALVMFVLSFGSVGLPSASVFTALPVYLAMGIPLEGYLLIQAVDAIPDLLKTALNVTGDLTLATVVTRLVAGTRRAVTLQGAPPR